jgi:hypothetical protein
MTDNVGMTSQASLYYPCSFVLIRGQFAFSGISKKVKISKQTEPNIGELPGPPSDLRLGEKCVFAVRTQEVIENNAERSLGYPRNLGIQSRRRSFWIALLSLTMAFSLKVRNKVQN